VFDDTGKVVATMRARDGDTAQDRAQYEFGQRWTDAWRVYRRPDESPEPEKKLSPRAQVAKRITTKKQEPEQLTQATNERGVPYWEIFERETGHVVHTFLADTQADAWEDTKNWLAGMNAEQPNLFSMRPKMKATTPVAGQVKDIDPDVAQNFAPQDATEVRRNWEFVDRITGRVVHNMTSASYNQANTVQADVERRYPNADIYLRSVERSN
jgi:hypothetical protein